jgi:hypothetical protein
MTETKPPTPKEAFEDTFKRIYSGNNKKMLDNLGKEKPPQKFPLCEKYIGITEASDHFHPQTVEQALSKLEMRAKAAEKVAQVLAMKGNELEKRIAELELELNGEKAFGLDEHNRVKQLEAENKTLGGNLEACLDINKQYKAENSKLKAEIRDWERISKGKSKYIDELKARLEKAELELEAEREPLERDEP